MPWNTGPIQVGVHGEGMYLHVATDGTAEAPKASQVAGAAPTPAAVPMGSLMEMLLGHRSGGTLKAAPFASPGSTAGSQTGAGVTYAAATLTDPNQNFATNALANFAVITGGTGANAQADVVTSNTATVLTMKSNFATTPANGTPYLLWFPAEQNAGATVTYAAGPANALVDTAKTWAVNQWRGAWVMVAAELRQIVSNTATQLTLDRAWGTTPGANQAYFILGQLAPGWTEVQRGMNPLTIPGVAGSNPNNI